MATINNGQFKKGIIPHNKGKIFLVDKLCTCGCLFKSRPFRKAKYCSKLCFTNSRRGCVASEETKKKQSLAKKGIKLSEEHKSKIGRRGELNPRWIKDRTLIKLGDRNLHDPLAKQWRMQVKDRDNWSCRIADNKCNGRLEAHHILRWKDFPELRYEVNNGITLCHYHHPRKVVDEKRLIPTFMGLVSVSSGTLSQQ